MNQEPKTRLDTPLLLPIAKIVDENPHVKTFWFDCDLGSKPGQFVMLWVPDMDQKPFSIAYDEDGKFGLSIFAVGPTSKKLFEMKAGDRVGITGPYGNPYTEKPNTHYIGIGGGYGAGPVGLLAERLQEINSTMDFCVGARSADLLLFEERIAKLPNATVHVSTDDGSKGHKGFVTQIVEEILINKLSNKQIILATCGPEMMEKAVLDLANKYDVECEISIERYMKCGFGICGQCTVDPIGIRMCVEGPVVNRETANQITEFGKYHRDKSGAKHNY